MSLLEAITVERFVHEFASPDFGEVRTDMAARTDRMTGAVNEVIEKLAPRRGQSDRERAKALTLVEACVLLMSDGLDMLKTNLDAMDPNGPLFIDAELAHDAMVEDYYRLLTLRAELDPLTRAGTEAEALGDGEDVASWMERQVGPLRAKA